MNKEQVERILSMLQGAGDSAAGLIEEAGRYSAIQATIGAALLGVVAVALALVAAWASAKHRECDGCEEGFFATAIVCLILLVPVTVGLCVCTANAVSAHAYPAVAGWKALTGT